MLATCRSKNLILKGKKGCFNQPHTSVQIMELVTYGWIGGAILAPTISAICIVVLFLFNVYKNSWKNVDHFLVGLTVQEIVSSILCFALSILNLLHNRNEQLCGLITGLWFAIRMLQLVTLTSLAVDRALILKWPYQYRFSIRSLQIKSHLIFISLCCSTIALFAYSSRLDQNTIQNLINDLPASPSISSNLAYFDLFSNPLFGAGASNSDTLGLTTSSLESTTPLYNQESIRNNLIQNRSASSNDRLALPLRSPNQDQTSFLNSQSIYSSSTSHLSSSLPPPFSSTSLPAPTLSMNHNLLYKQFSVCSLHPLFWQRTFNIVLLGLFALLSLITVFCFIYVDCTRRCNEKRKLITQTNYLSTSSNYLNNLNKPQHKLTGISILDSHHHNEFNSSRYQLNSQLKANHHHNQMLKSTSNLVQIVNNVSPGNTNTTTTTCASNEATASHQTSSSASNHKSLHQAASLSTIALGDELMQNEKQYDKLNQFNDQTNDSMSALMIDHDLTRSTDALASFRKDKNYDRKSKLLSKSQPSLLHNLHASDSFEKKNSNLSVYSFDIDLSKKQRRLQRTEFRSIANQYKYSNQLKQQFKQNRLPVRSSSMITQNNLQLDENEPFSMQSREDLFSRKYLRDHYKICDLRWSSVVTCTSLCYAVNHAPTIVSFFFFSILLALDDYLGLIH